MMYEDAPFDAPAADPRLEPVARKVAARLFAQLEASPPPGVEPIEVADYQRRQGERFVQQLVAMLMPYADKVLARITGGKPQGVRAVVTPPAASDCNRGTARANRSSSLRARRSLTEAWMPPPRRAISRYGTPVARSSCSS